MCTAVRPLRLRATTSCRRLVYASVSAVWRAAGTRLHRRARERDHSDIGEKASAGDSMLMD